MKFCALVMVILFCSCSPTKQSSDVSKSTYQAPPPLPKNIYLADILYDGNYQIIELNDDEEPQAKQGKHQFTLDFYRNLRYPAVARENGTHGIVTLEVYVDLVGKVTKVEIKKGISPECDLAAREAYIHASRFGFTPLLYQGMPTNYKMETSVGFYLN